MHDNTLQTIPEAQADPVTREIYDDIKSTMGVALVNLVWRYLAVTPTALEWSWQALKPHYTNGAIPAAAWILRESLPTPTLPSFSAIELQQLSCDSGEMALVESILRTYERGNAQNLVAMCYLRSLLDGGNTNTAPDRPFTLNTQQQQAETADRVNLTLPPLPNRSDLPDDTWSHIEAMSEVWVPIKHRGLTPSVFRHIAHWPDLLKLYRSRLHTLKTNNGFTLPVLTEQTIDLAESQASGLGVATENLPVLDSTDHTWLRHALDLFIHGMISPGVVLVPAMRSVLPKPSDPVTAL